MNEQRIRRDIVTVGGSAGSVELVLDLFTRLPGRLDATFFIVIHRSPHFESQLRDLLQRRTDLAVREPKSEEPVLPGHLYLAPRDLHIRLRKGRIVPDRGPKEHFTRPAVDPLFISAAEEYRERVVGVLLSGGGADGSSGLIAIKRTGGVGIVQDPAEAKHPSMPATGIARDDVEAVLKSRQIAQILVPLVGGQAVDIERRELAPERFVDLR
jgi:two-component system chemotaxis response regulator CheB